MKKKLLFENDLVRKIKNNEIELEHAIMHQDLSTSLRNESRYLLDFLFSKKNLEELIKYALFDKKSQIEEYSSVRQINNNASNILSYPSNKIKQKIVKIEGDNSKPLLLEKLEEFIKNKDFYTDPYYAGHFERIYENILRHDDSFETFFDNFAENLFPFLANNITILPYKELFQVLLEDFTDKMGEEKTDFAIKTILQYATYYSCVLFFNSSNKKNSLFASNQQLRHYFEKYKPMNKIKKEIPIPQFIKSGVDNNEAKFKKKAKEKGKNFFPKEFKINDLDKNIQEDELETILTKTYFFLSCIFRACFNNNDFEILKKDDFLEMILYCGIFNDPESLSSMEAFRILEHIYYGSFDEGFDNAPYQSECFLKTIDEYAEFISYDHTTLNILEINAFPIFWNHRYKYKEELNKKCLIDVDSVLNINESSECDEKQTPFLILRPFLFADPPISNKLIFSYIKIFHYLDYLRRQITDENDKPIDQYSPEDQEKIKEIDLIVYEFIQRPLPYYIGEKNNKYKFCNFYQALENVIPYFPKSEVGLSKKDQIRAALNGSSFEICQIFQHSSFFIINNEVSELLFEINKNFTPTSNSVIDVLQHFSRELYITTNKQKTKDIKKVKLNEFSSSDDENDS